MSIMCETYMWNEGRNKRGYKVEKEMCWWMSETGTSHTPDSDMALPSTHLPKYEWRTHFNPHLPSPPWKGLP